MDIGSTLSTAWVWVVDQSAGMIAFFAFVATGLQAWYARQNNRVSVRPYLFASTSYQDVSEAVVKVSASLENCGLGPAFIKNYSILIKGTAHPVTRPDDVRALVESVAGLKASNDYFWVYRQHAIMQAQTKMQIASATFTMPVNATSEQTKEALLRRMDNDIHVLIEFESAYGERFTYDSRVHTTTLLTRREKIAQWIKASLPACGSPQQ